MRGITIEVHGHLVMDGVILIGAIHTGEQDIGVGIVLIMEIMVMHIQRQDIQIMDAIFIIDSMIKLEIIK